MQGALLIRLQMSEESFQQPSGRKCTTGVLKDFFGVWDFEF